MKPSAFAALLLAMPVTAPCSAQAPVKVTAEIRSKILDAIAARLTDTYVDADTGRLIAQRIEARRRAGAYDGFENPAQLAEAVTRDLRSVNGDLHLSLRYAPEPAPTSGRAPAPDDGGQEGRRENFGLGRAELLDGNVGYLEITAFLGLPGYQEAVVDALRFLSRTDAMIIDLRRNGGGSSEMTHFVFSHFLGAEPVRTIDVRRRSATEPVRRISLAQVPGPRRPSVPLFLLTSGGTGSAAEEFTFVLKNLHRATVVGTRTAGAGHMVNGFPVGNGFTLSLSITRVSDPATGREWEQVGVQPDVPVPADRALIEAQVLALKALIPGMTDPAMARVDTRLLDGLEARRRGDQPEARTVAGLAGEYEGRVVSITGGRLYFTRRAGGLPQELTWLTGTRFSLGAVLYVFQERNGVIQLTVEQPDGTQVTLQKGAPAGG